MPLGPEPIPIPALWRELVERMPVVVYVSDFDPEGTLRYLSPQVDRLLGRPADDFLADHELWYRCIHPDDVARVRGEERRVFAEETTFDCEYRMLAADGREIVVWERDVIIRDEAGRPAYTQGALVDVTAVRDAERRAEQQAERADAYLDVVGAIVAEVTPDGRIVMVNRATLELLGRAREQVVGSVALDHVAAGDRDQVTANIRGILEGTIDESRIEMPLVDAAGCSHDVLWEWTVLRDDDGMPTGMILAGMDVTERRVAEQRAAYLAGHDPVTELPNRMLLDEHLELAVARARRDGTAVGLLVVDIDDFALVNDELGVAGGDCVLHRLATRLATRCREQDVLARVAGDEFAILLTGLDPSTAGDTILAIAEDYHATLRTPFTVDGTDFDIDASAGCAVFPADATDAEGLRRCAASALDVAKSDGRGSLRRFQPSTSGRRRPLSLTARLRRAMACDELVLHWQPVVHVPSGRRHGAEALVRWQTEDRLLPPGAFVPYAEESRLIERLDDHVLDLACAELARWTGLEHAGFGVNASPHSFASRGYAGRVRELVRSHGIAAERLVIELTESAVMSRDGDAAATLHELADLGVAVAIDDFGTGYSSLTRMIELPVAYAKLDRSFLARGADDPATAAVIASVVAMSERLGSAALVEGVETEDQLALLVELGVPYAQGFLLGRPAPAAEVFPLLAGAPTPVTA